MIPQRRFTALLDQARSYQRLHCLYHNSPLDSSAFSLYMDHQCDKSAFPRVTTAILEVHTDEVWNMAWSHDGNYLATAGKDRTAIIWRIGPETEPSMREYAPEMILRDHPYSVGCLAWSVDDSILLTSSDSIIKMWYAKTGLCMRMLEVHSETVTSLAWLPDGSGFISGGLDRRIILWDKEGKQRDSWGSTPLRVTDLAVTPDFTRLVAVGMYNAPTPVPSDLGPARGQPGDVVSAVGNGAANSGNGRASENRMIIYDLVTKQIES
jgi:WD40 repeat protein